MNTPGIRPEANGDTIDLHIVTDLDSWLGGQPPAVRDWVAGQSYSADRGAFLSVPAFGDAPRMALVGGGDSSLATLGGGPTQLPEGSYRPLPQTGKLGELDALGWALGAYQYTRYKAAKRAPAELVIEDEALRRRVTHLAEGTNLTRDLINAPANDMLPSHLEAASRALAEAFDAGIEVTTGAELLAAGYETIHAVGRASADAPRLIDLTWGDTEHPQVTLVGKGVCFDSGGLNIKPAGGMRTMKKDMGGAAQVLGLAQIIMAEALPVRLRVLVSAAENAISANAYRPGDIIRTYKGLTVEIDNTDAEGRLVMCDALALACEDKPDLLVDYATLTGSARSAVGAEIAAMFANDDALAESVYGAGVSLDDAVWRMPLHAPYKGMLKSTHADLVNSAASPYAGAITAALFLQHFVDDDVPWLHFDLMAWNLRTRPGRPEGGEAMGVRAVFDHLERRYGG
ncbi:MAG: leucyl aminopeptidase family protein [Pseudomonadota bacterium]